MSSYLNFIEHIRELVANADLETATKELSALLKNSIRLDEAIIQSARYNNVTQLIRQGLINFEDANVTKNQISKGVLELLRDIEAQEKSDPSIKTEIERFAFQIQNSKNVIAGSTINAGRDVHIGDVKNYVSAPEKRTIKLLTGFIQVAENSVIGRDAQIMALEKSLGNNHTVALMNGMGGIGKTTVALLFLARNEKKFDHLAWIDINDTIENAFLYNSELQNSLEIKDKVDGFIGAKQPDAAYNCILQALRVLGGKTLIVLDNANNHADLMKALKNLEKIGCKIVVTTRDTSATPSDYKVIRVDKLAPADAQKVFELYYRDDENQTFKAEELADINDICKNLDYHTLLIEMVAKTGRVNNILLAQLRDIVQKGYAHILEIKKRKIPTGISGKKAELKNEDDQTFIAEHLRNIFKNIHWLPNNETEKPFVTDILKYHAVLTSEFHNEDDLIKYFGLTEAHNTTIFTQWQLMAQNGWLQEEKASNGLQYRMHPLLQEMIVHQEILGAFTAESVLPAFIFFSVYFSIDYNTNDHAIYKRDKLELGKNIIDILSKSTNAEFAVLQNNLALILQDLGNLQGAKELMERALTADEKNYEANHPAIAIRQSNLATILQALGDTQGAKALLERALASDEINFEVHHPSIALSQSNLAMVLKDLEDLQRAKVLMERALASNEIYYEANHPSIARSQSNLAMILQNLGDLPGAKVLMERALASDEINFEANHPSIARSQSNLATILKNLGDLPGAKVLMERALASEKINFEANHPAIANRQSNLAMILYALGDLQGAKTYCTAAYATFKNLYGDDHFRTKFINGNLEAIKAAMEN